MNGRSLLKSTLFILNLIFSSALLLSNYAHLIDPNTFLFPAFFGLAFIPLWILNIILLFTWLMIKPPFALLNLAVALLCWNNMQLHMQWPVPKHVQGEKSIDIMSFNVRLFDLYNWKGNKDTRNEILKYLKANSADLYCFQEFFNTNQNSYFNTLDTILKSGIGPNVHDEYTAILHEGKSKFGIATLSAYPIINKKVVPLDTAMNNIAIYSDIIVEEETLRVFNIHLASVHLSGLENNINKHLESNDQKGQMEDVVLISNRLASGFKRRAKQADVIKTYIDASPYPVIVVGDFNDTPASYAYHRISDGLFDAFESNGSWIGSTYIGLYPMLRIDFILVDPRLEILSFKTEHIELSDHKPIRAALTWKKGIND